MKKMLKVFGIIAVVVCLIVSVVACDKNDKINWVSLNQSEYSSVDDALKGYVKEELAYSRVDYNDEVRDVVIAEYVSKESKGEIKTSKIDLPDSAKTNLINIEKFAVKVKIATAPEEGKDADFTEATQMVYVLNYGEKYNFLVAVPEVGERITKSYAQKITNSYNYRNCTMNQEYKEYEGEEEDFVFEEYKFTTDATYSVTYYDKTRYDNRTPGGDENSNDRRSYVVKNGDGIAAVGNSFDENDEEKWTARAIGGDDIQTVEAYNADMIEEMFSISQYAAMFTKTANGLEFKLENNENGNTSATEYKITLTDDKVTAMYMKVSYSYTDGDDTYNGGYEVDLKISNFGSTTVSVPAEVTAALSQIED